MVVPGSGPWSQTGSPAARHWTGRRTYGIVGDGECEIKMSSLTVTNVYTEVYIHWDFRMGAKDMLDFLNV